MKRILFILILLSVSFSSCAQRNYTAKKLLFSQVQKPYVNYGYLYNWWAATEARKITSSDDWVVPTTTQSNALRTYLGGTSTVGGKLKETGTVYWNPNVGATNEFGFNGRGAGERISGFTSILQKTNYINSNENSPTAMFSWQLLNSSNNWSNVVQAKYYGWSIRLLYTGAGMPTSYTGNDGKIYRVVTIGTQTWLADNLAETKYRNGDWITGYDGGVYTPISDTNWAALTTEAMCIYNDNESYR